MEEFIGKLPFILSAFMALITGILGVYSNKNQDYIYTSMIISIISFGIIGFIVKTFIQSVLKEKDETINEDISEKESETTETKGNVIDLKVDDSNNPEINNFYGDDFSPLEVSKVIKTNLISDEK